MKIFACAGCVYLCLCLLRLHFRFVLQAPAPFWMTAKIIKLYRRLSFDDEYYTKKKKRRGRWTFLYKIPPYIVRSLTWTDKKESYPSHELMRVPCVSVGLSLTFHTSMVIAEIVLHCAATQSQVTQVSVNKSPTTPLFRLSTVIPLPRWNTLFCSVRRFRR